MVLLWTQPGLPSHRELNGQFLLPMIGVQRNNTSEPGFISSTPKKRSQGTQAFISCWTICQPCWPQRFITKNQDPSCPLWNFTSHTFCEMHGFAENWPFSTIGKNRWTVTTVWQAEIKRFSSSLHSSMFGRRSIQKEIDIFVTHRSIQVQLISN